MIHVCVHPGSSVVKRIFPVLLTAKFTAAREDFVDKEKAADF